MVLIEGIAPYQIASYARFMQRAPEPVRWRLLGVRYVISWRAELGDAGPWFQPVEVTARGDVPDAAGNVTPVLEVDITFPATVTATWSVSSPVAWTKVGSECVVEEAP